MHKGFWMHKEFWMHEAVEQLCFDDLCPVELLSSTKHRSRVPLRFHAAVHFSPHGLTRHCCMKPLQRAGHNDSPCIAFCPNNPWTQGHCKRDCAGHAGHNHITINTTASGWPSDTGRKPAAHILQSISISTWACCGKGNCDPNVGSRGNTQA